MSGKIFISYRREDSAPHALSIGQYLEHEFGRRSVFIDVDMYAGSKFPVVLEQRLAACKVMLVLIGPRWLSAIDDEGCLRLDNPEDWVRLEISSALERGITVIPVRIGGADLPKKASLPADIRGLLDHQAATVSTDGFRNEMAGLVRDIQAIPGQKYRRTALAVSILCVAALLVGSMLIFKDQWLPVLQSEVKGITSAANKTYAEKDYPALRPGPEWVLYGVPVDDYMSYFKPASIRVYPNRAAVMVRSKVDPTKPLANDQILEHAAYHEFQQVLECKSQRAVIARTTIFDRSGQPIYHFKWGDPDFVDINLGIIIQPGSIGETLRALVCTPNLRSAYIDEKELSDLQLIPLSSTTDGNGQIFFKPERLTDAGLATALVVIKLIKETALSEMLPKNTKDLHHQNSNISCKKFLLVVPRIASLPQRRNITVQILS